MRIVIAAVGRLKRGPEHDLVEDYLIRARAGARRLGFMDVSLVEIEAPRGLEGKQRQKREAELLLECVPSGGFVVALDERGESTDSQAFSGLLSRLRDQGAPAVIFVIGGADGLDDIARNRAEKLMSFGRATFPHLLVRVMLAEQIYRAMTIMSGHPYHRA